MGKLVKKLTWDSEFFKYSVGRVFIPECSFENLKAIKEEATEYRLVYVFSFNEIKMEGLKHVDTKVILEKHIEKSVLEDNISNVSFEIEAYNAEKHNREQLKELALQSGEFSRFFIDDGFKNGEYRKLYLEWIAKSLDQILAFETLVVVNNEKTIGFLTLAKSNDETAEIGLIAIDILARGKGIASSLIRQALISTFNKGFRRITVATQSNNRPAVNLYLKAGFKEISSEHIYHIWNDDTI